MMSRRSARIAAAAAAGFLSLVAAPAVLSASPEDAAPAAAPAPAPAPVITKHSGVFHGKRIRYSAIVEPIDIQGKDGKPAARIVSFAYVKDGAAGRNDRPVLFIFNGGPITPSMWLHIGALGPKRLEIPDDLSADPQSFKLVDNHYSPLDAADLVFIDPAQTGFSRVLPGIDPKEFYSVAGDGREVTAFIANWLAKHHRLKSPIYILGESYGTMRAAEVAGQLTELKTPLPSAGVFLMGQAVNIIEYAQRPQNIISYVVSLPTLAALASYHGKARHDGETLKAFMDQAWDYAKSDYLAALFEGDTLSPAKRDEVAEQLEKFSGIPASYYSAHMLRISKEEFRRELLKDKGLLLGRADGRYTAPLTDKGLAPDPSDVIMPAFERAFARYVKNDLRVDWKETYEMRAGPDDLSGWDWGGSSPFSRFAYGDRLQKAFEANPKFRLVIGNGYYDTQTTVGAARYAIMQGGWPAGRTEAVFYPGGHMPYTIGATARQFGEDVRAFVSGKKLSDAD